MDNQQEITCMMCLDGTSQVAASCANCGGSITVCSTCRPAPNSWVVAEGTCSHCSGPITLTLGPVGTEAGQPLPTGLIEMGGFELGNGRLFTIFEPEQVVWDLLEDSDADDEAFGAIPFHLDDTDVPPDADASTETSDPGQEESASPAAGSSVNAHAQQILLSEPQRCGICLEEMESSQDLHVCRNGHVFHRECLEEWSRTLAEAFTHPTCPTCRVQLRLR